MKKSVLKTIVVLTSSLVSHQAIGAISWAEQPGSIVEEVSHSNPALSTFTLTPQAASYHTAADEALIGLNFICQDRRLP